jgi:cell division protein FtsQ
MDGQRRVVKQVVKSRLLARDCALSVRVAARGAAVLFLSISLLHGILAGGHLNYPGSVWLKLPGRLAGFIGMAADDIQITGLQHHDPRDVLSSMGVKPGGPLLGFDAARARDILLEQDWVDSAVVQRRFPNQLVVAIEEREPFVVWQHLGKVVVVDRRGKPMSGLDPREVNVLLHVSGAGANTAALELVNQIEAVPELSNQIRAAVRVGERRWTLYLKTGLKVALPEFDIAPALKRAERIVAGAELSAGGVDVVDLRIAGEVYYKVAAVQTNLNAEGAVGSLPQ